MFYNKAVEKGPVLQLLVWMCVCLGSYVFAEANAVSVWELDVGRGSAVFGDGTLQAEQLLLQESGAGDVIGVTVSVHCREHHHHHQCLSHTGDFHTGLNLLNFKVINIREGVCDICHLWSYHNCCFAFKTPLIHYVKSRLERVCSFTTWFSLLKYI